MIVVVEIEEGRGGEAEPRAPQGPVVHGARHSLRYFVSGQECPGRNPGQSADDHGAEPGFIARAAVETLTPEAVFLAPEIQNLGPPESLPGAPGSTEGDGSGLPCGQAQRAGQGFSTEIACGPAHQKPRAVWSRGVRAEPARKGDAEPESEGRAPDSELDAPATLGTLQVERRKPCLGLDRGRRCVKVLCDEPIECLRDLPLVLGFEGRGRVEEDAC